ncbi:MAG: hypothetical protein ACI4VQ_00160 [Clostridia bacterium]
MKINDMQIEIKKSWYNKSQLQEDGVTHIIDTEHQYPVYQFGLAKNYFDMEEKSDVIRTIIKDLEGMIQTLGELLEKEDVKEKDSEQEK